MSNKRNAEQDSAGKSGNNRRQAGQFEGPGKTEKQTTEQADGTSKTDRQQQGGQKNQQGQKGKQGVPPSWQRQPERRPEQPNR